VIRPSDGRLIYINEDENFPREFHSDECPVWQPPKTPVDLLLNDPVVPTPMCPTDASAHPVQDVRLSPEGDLYYECDHSFDGGSGYAWYAPSGALVHQETSTANRLYAITSGKLALIGDFPWQLVHLDSGVTTAISPALPFDSPNLVAVRASSAGGFLVAASAPLGNDAKLWEVTASGVSSLVGSYPSIPSQTMYVIGGSSNAALDGCGALLQGGFGQTRVEPQIVWRTLDGGSSIVYDEGNNPFVKAGHSLLVTGP
jgi:hypothetical protein